MKNVTTPSTTVPAAVFTVSHSPIQKFLKSSLVFQRYRNPATSAAIAETISMIGFPERRLIAFETLKIAFRKPVCSRLVTFCTVLKNFHVANATPIAMIAGDSESSTPVTAGMLSISHFSASLITSTAPPAFCWT